MNKQLDWLGSDHSAKTADQLDKVDAEIKKVEHAHDLQLREYPVEVLVYKFTEGRDIDDAEIFIPEYQREFIWSPRQQSRFIESLFMGLPIPPLFLAFTDDAPRAGALEVIDGTQRLRTLDYFLNNKLRLCDLKKIPTLNGFVFSELPRKQQRIFKAKAIRVAILNSNHVDEAARREMFDRLNSGGTKLQPMEVRRGKSDGEFLALLEKMALNPKFLSLCPMPQKKIDLREPEEMLLRFFAYSHAANDFVHEVSPFLTKYLDEKNKELRKTPEASKKYVDQFEKVLDFVQKNFPNGFRKDSTFNSVPRVRFEAISIGIDWALRENPTLHPAPVENWLNSDKFKKHTRSDATNSKPKLFERIWFVRDSLLGREPKLYPRARLRKSDDEWKNLDLLS